MTSPLVIRRYDRGPRCWVIGQRIHHGAAGCALLALALAAHRPLVAALGLALCAHDRADIRRWFALDRAARSL